MEFSEFKGNLIKSISKEDKSAIKLIDKNRKLVEEYLSDSSLQYVKSFIDDLFTPIINGKKFKVTEKVLKDPSMKVVLREFKKSTILIKACENGNNKKAIEWLLSMDIDINLQDKNGRTAIMYAVQRWNLESIIDTFLKRRIKDLADNDGNTTIFYACNNAQILNKILKSKLFDYKHINNNHENALFYCIKRDKLKSISLLLEKPDIDCNLVNNDGKTVAMLLTENVRFNELKSLVRTHPIDVNYINKYGESIVSVFIKQYYNQLLTIGNNTSNDYARLKTKNFGNTLRTLVELNCNFNCILDEDGNTPALFFLMVKDYVSLYYLLDNCANFDLSIKNKYGINASYLSLFIQEIDIFDLYYDRNKNTKHITFNSLKSQLMNNKTFDYNYLDSNNNTILMYFLVRNDPSASAVIEKMPPKTLFSVNNKKENSIIISTKLGNTTILKKLLEHKDCTLEIVNAQDELGNTALHYAYQIGDPYAITLLKNHYADPSIKNNEGKDAVEASENIDTDIMILQTKSIPSSLVNDPSEKQKLFSVLKQKTDDNVNHQIKNYRVAVFQQDYNTLLKDEYLSNYKPSPYNEGIQLWVGEGLYPIDIEDLVGIRRLAF